MLRMLNMPEKQLFDRVQFWKHFDIASNICSDILQFMQNYPAKYHRFDGFLKKIAAAQLANFHSILN